MRLLEKVSPHTVPKTQPHAVVPQKAGDQGARDFSVALQSNLEALFRWAHEHPEQAALPAATDGAVGDIRIVAEGGRAFLVAKSQFGWLRVNNMRETSYTTEWDDLRFPAHGINPPGAASDPSVSTTNGLLYFSGTADNIISGIAQFPHSWAEGTEISPHIHLIFPTSVAANTRWKLEYGWANVNGSFAMTIPTTYNAATTYSYTETITVANPQSAQKHVVAEWSKIKLPSGKLSLCMPWRISRLASSDAADTETSDVVLMEFDIHYQIDASGSRQEYVK